MSADPESLTYFYASSQVVKVLSGYEMAQHFPEQMAGG